MDARKKASLKLAAAGILPYAGFLVLYFIPLTLTFAYAVTETKGTMGFSGLLQVWNNPYFQLGLRNLMLIGAGCLAGGFLLALALAVLLCRHPRRVGVGAVILILSLLCMTLCGLTLFSGKKERMGKP